MAVIKGADVDTAAMPTTIKPMSPEGGRATALTALRGVLTRPWSQPAPGRMAMVSDPTSSTDSLLAALTDEGLRRSGVLWLDLPTGPRIAWHAYADGTSLIVHGGAEQALPGLADLTRVRVLVRSKDTGALLAGFEATVVRVEPGGAEWVAATARLRAARQSPRQGAGVDRWATDSVITRLVPVA